MTSREADDILWRTVVLPVVHAALAATALWYFEAPPWVVVFGIIVVLRTA